MTKTTEIPVPHGFTVTETETEIVIAFAYDASLVRFFRKLPSAKFDRSRSAWIVSPRYRKATSKLLGEIKGIRELARAEAQERVADKRSADEEALEAMRAGGKMSTPRVNVRSVDGILRVIFDYAPAAVAAVKVVPGARFDSERRLWTVPVTEHEALRAAIPAIDAAVAAVEAANAAKRRAEDEAREKRHANRLIVLSNDRPGIGQAIRKFGRVLIVESFGQSFRAPDDLSSFGYLGFEDQIVCYAYCREASETEIAALEAAERAERAEATAAEERRKFARATLADLDRQMDERGERPEKLERTPSGPTIFHQGARYEITGGGTRWILDGKMLWRVRRNGADGDDWSLNNAPGAIVTGMPATPAAVRALLDLRAEMTPDADTGHVSLEHKTVLATCSVTTRAGREIELTAIAGTMSTDVWAHLDDGKHLVERACVLADMRGEMVNKLKAVGATHCLVLADTAVQHDGTSRRGGQPIGAGLGPDQWARYEALLAEAQKRKTEMFEELRAERDAAFDAAVRGVLDGEQP